MKKFKFLFLAALVAVISIGCAQPTNDDTPIISDAQPTVVKVSTAYREFSGSGEIGFFKTVSVTYPDHVDKYEITTALASFIKDGWYKINAVLLNAPSQIDFFNGTPLIVIDKNKEPNTETEFKFSEIYTKVE